MQAAREHHQPPEVPGSLTVPAALTAAWLGGLMLEWVSRLVDGSSAADLSIRAAIAMGAMQVALVLLAALVLAPARWLVRTRRPRVAFVYLWLSAMASLTPVALSATQGAWIARQRWVELVRYGGPAALAVLVAASVLAWLTFVPRLHRWWRAAALLGLLAVTLLATVVNATQLPGLYRQLHLTAMACTGLLAHMALTETLAALGAWHPQARSLNWLGPVCTGLFAAAFALNLASAEPTLDEVLLKSERAGYLLRVLMPRREHGELRELLLRAHLAPEAPEEALPQGSRWKLPADWNVVLIVIDTLRADVVGPDRKRHPSHRFSASDAPTLSRLYDKSFRFSRAYAGAPWTGYSMPSMFRSREAHERNKYAGTALAARMAGLGRYPVAVVPDFFTYPWGAESDLSARSIGIPELLDGMAEVEVYSEKHQDQQAALVRHMLERVRDKPFFAWFHYFALHSPGWSGARPPRGRWPTAYPRALRWMDAQVRDVMSTLRTLGISDRTLMIVTGDHGEGLGDDGIMFHGPALNEEVVRVPLMFFVPGYPGRSVDATVGNIDIVPTLADLMGAPPDPMDRGRTLVPLLLGDPSQDSTRRCLIFDGSDERTAVVQGSRKHVLDLKTGARFAFDLASDPYETTNVYDPANPVDIDLGARLVSARPELFASQMSEPATLALLDQRLSRLTRESVEDITILLRLVRLAPSAQRLETLARAARGAPDPILLAIIDALATLAPARAAQIVSARIRTAPMDEHLVDFVQRLAQLGIQPIAQDLVVRRLAEASQLGKATWRAWLTLTANWNLTWQDSVRPLETMLNELMGEAPPDAGALQLVLRAIAHLKGPLDPEAAERLSERVVLLLEHSSVSVAAASCSALANLRSARAEELLRARIDSTYPFVIRLRALQGLVRVAGGRAMDEVTRIGTEPGFAAHAIAMVGEAGGPDALPFLANFEARGTSVIRYEARLAREKVQRRQAAQGP